MRKRYKVVINVDIDDPDDPYPAGGSFTHFTRIEGVVHGLLWNQYWPSWLKPAPLVSLDKVIDKGEI